MRILQINTGLNNSSTGKIVNHIGEKIINKGWSSYIAYSRGIVDSKSVAIKIGNTMDKYYHAFKTRFFDSHGFESTIATKKLIRKIKLINPDIVHLHNLHGYYLNIEVLFRYLSTANFKVIWTLHDCWSFTGHCTHFDYIQCNKWKTACYKCPQKTSYPSSILIDNSKENYIRKKKAILSLGDLVVVPVSRWLHYKVKDSFMCNFQTRVITNGIDLSIFNNLNNSYFSSTLLKDKFIVLGVASSWNKKKGIDDFIKLSKKIDKSIAIVLVGVDKSVIDIPDNVFIIPKVENQKELASIYASSNLYLNLTYEDTYPTTNLESIACNTPVVTYNTGGSVESIIDNTGYIVDKGDIDAILRRIEIERNTAKKENIYKVARDYFNKDDRFDDYIALYSKLSSKIE